MLEDARLELFQALVIEAGLLDGIGRDRLVGLQGLDGEGTGHTQLLPVDHGLVEQRHGFRRLVVGQRTQRRPLHGLVVEAVAHVPRVARQAVLFVLQRVPGIGP